jgi:hypothetical protein
MDTYYARHTWRMDVDEATRQSIFEAKQIAVHYPNHSDGVLHDEDIRSKNPGDHDARGRRALNALNGLATTGGYVLAEYHNKNEVLIGCISPGTEILFLEGKWGDLHKLSGRTAVLKTLQMNRVEKIFTADATVLLAGRPRQGTLMKWPRVRTMVQNLVEGVTEPQSLADLSPAQQEIMCSEFLRQPEAAAHGLPVMQTLLLPVGSTLRDLDIYGITSDGRKIAAQVTFSKFDSIAWKIDKLKRYRDLPNVISLMFCDVEKELVHEGTQIFPLSEVFRLFTASERGRSWLLSGGTAVQVR